MAIDPVVNFGKVTVSTTYDAAATSIVLSGGDGAKLPAPATDGAFNLVWWESTTYPDPSDDPNREVVRCTARSTDTLTVTRAQESTSASTKNTGGKVYLMALTPTAKMITDLKALTVASVSKFANYTILDTDNYATFLLSGANTTTLPNANIKRVIRFVKTDAGSIATIASGASTNTIEGGPILELKSQYDTVVVESDGVSLWMIL